MERNMLIAIIVALIVLLYAGHRTNFFGYRTKSELRDSQHAERHALRDEHRQEKHALEHKQESERDAFDRNR